jgi:hypothetical protein
VQTVGLKKAGFTGVRRMAGLEAIKLRKPSLDAAWH